MPSFFDIQKQLLNPTADSDAARASEAADNALSVSAFVNKVDDALKAGLPRTIHIVGELSEFKAHSSGHWYFTLCDDEAEMRCVMFKASASAVKFEPQIGMEVVIAGSAGMFKQRGTLQFYARSMNPIGQGAMELAFQQLQAKLAKAGLFDADRKKPLPPYPRTVAIVTSSQAAALADVLKVLQRHHAVRILLLDVPVQGNTAAEAIAANLRWLNQHTDDLAIDAVLLVRGGGSAEDLWAFNMEAVAHAIAAMNVPVVSGIGHETDVSIADLVADVHAHTPTEAARLVVDGWRIAADRVAQLGVVIRRQVRHAFEQASMRLRALEQHPLMRRPEAHIERARARLAAVEQRLHASARHRINAAERRLARAEGVLSRSQPAVQLALRGERLNSIERALLMAVQQSMIRRRDRLESSGRQLHALSPVEVLKRGYAVVTRKKGGKAVTDPADLSRGERLIIRVSGGAFEATADDPNQPSLF